MNDIDFYKGNLKDIATTELEVKSISDYMNAIVAINSTYRNLLYRGQANKEWEIVSSAYRVLHKFSTRPSVEQLKNYHSSLISEVKHLKDEQISNTLKGVALLAHLQHHWVKTCLIDYSLNPLVALWFACTGKVEVDGKIVNRDGCVFFLEKNKLLPIDEELETDQIFNKDATSIYIFDPPSLNRRIIIQQSILLFSPLGVIDTSANKKKIVIPHACKDSIVKELALVGITRKNLFPDFSGFVEWFSFEIKSDKERYDEIVEEANKFYSTADYDKAISSYTKAIEFAEKDSIDLAFLDNNIGLVYKCQGDYSKALEWHEKALAIREKVLGKEHPDTATSYNNIALVYNKQGDYPKALEWHEKALVIYEKVLGKEHPDTATSYNNIALVYNKQGDYPKALEWHEKALVIYEKVLGKEHPDTATIYNNIALVYDNQGDYPKALEWYEKDLAICEKVLGKEHPSTATSYNNIALVYNNQGNYEKALEWYEKALVIREKVLGKEHPSTATSYNNIAAVYYKQGDYEKALEWYEKALAICEKVLGKEHPSTAATYNNIALVYNNQGDYPKALEWREKANGAIGKRE
ncbi:hypothetical protein FACS189441_7740 [Betaproteobacteria bacterium]|nr:hypothetical protein FACS189441_7740 [Betaproteobacteria bacterium]